MFNTTSALADLISALEKDIKERPDPRIAELQALQMAFMTIASGNPPASRSVEFRDNSKKQQFRDLVDVLLMASSDDRVHRQEIIKQAEMANMFPGTKDLDRDVSKYLSTDGTFAPDGDGYWKKKGGLRAVDYP